MDEIHGTTPADPVITGIGHVAIGPGDAGERPDPVPFLRHKKERKYMGRQDELAVVAAGRAIQAAGLAGEPLGARTGLYLVVGFIPFERADADSLLAGYDEVNPLLTFRCLPNMPAYHISACFGITGPYFVTYPGPAQFHLALDEAIRALAAGRIDRALVGAVVHQQNFLVEHHHRRIAHPVSPNTLMDAGAVIVLTQGPGEGGSIREHKITYRPHDPFDDPPVPSETFRVDGAPFSLPGIAGAASLPLALGLVGRGNLHHTLSSRDGFLAESRFVLP